MATIGASLQLFDQFSQTLTRAHEKLQSVLYVAERLRQGLRGRVAVDVDTNNATNRIERMRQRLRAMDGTTVLLPTRVVQQPGLTIRTNAVEKAMGQLNQQQQNNIQNQEKFNNKLHEGGNAADGLVGKLKGIAAAYLGIETGKKLFEATIGASMEQGKMESMFQARLGDNQTGTAFYQHYKSMALKMGFEVKDALTGALSFMSMTRNTDQIDKLMNISKRLAMFDTTGQGLSGAVFSTKEALSGDMVSLAERFNINKAAIAASGLKDAGKSGDVDKTIAAFNKLLEMQSMGEKALSKMLESPAYKWQQAIGNLKNGFADAGTYAMKALIPLIDKLNAFLSSTTYKKMTNELAFILRVVVAIFTSLIEAAKLFYTYLTQNEAAVTAIKSLAFAYGVFWTTLKIVTLAQWAFTTAMGVYRAAVTLAAGAQMGLNLAMLANPWGIVVAGLVTVVLGLATLVSTSDEARDHFKDLVSEILNLGTAFDQSLLKANDWLTNKTTEGINGTINFLNKVGKFFGKEDNMIKFNLPTNDYYKKLAEDKLKADQEAQKKVQSGISNFTAENIKQKAMELLNLKSDTAGENFDVEDYLKKYNQAVVPNKLDVGTVDKIKNKVDISSEDLKVMRDLAEMKNIQNFVTLTPTVQVTTGDINQPTDVDEMIRRIEEVMVTEIENSAQGAYR
ncbi:hypothetical protein GCM10023310_00940 [Paenibacillus vulneris]|uniref:Phage tail tape measure protein domain-containing protein n=1 Tax=Paenibacillus vulneris TaxID=1133364 RepID=A0ABW3UYR2_9BACL